jgi:hypothetical protein
MTGKLLEKTKLSGYSNETYLGQNLQVGIYAVSFYQGKIYRIFKKIKVN